MKSLKISIGCDHAGFEYKEILKKELESKGHSVKDFGTNSKDSVDYPDFVHPLASAVENKECDFGVLLCGSANGVAMTANKHKGIRAALVWNKSVAALTRQHNDANVLCLPARFISPEEAKELLEIFLATEFEGGRHQNRIDKMQC